MLTLSHRSRLPAAKPIAASLWGLTIALSACTGLPSPGSVESEQKWWLMVRADCRQFPERYGFPYTREAYVRTQFVFGNGIPDLGGYCSRVARVLTGQTRH